MFYFFLNLGLLVLNEMLFLNVNIFYIIVCLLAIYPVVWVLYAKKIVSLLYFVGIVPTKINTNAVTGFIVNICYFFKKKIHILRWKPIFRKTSYFGLYRANKNRWVNK